MVASNENNNSSGRIPALGFRFLGLIFVSILLMYFDNRDDHLETVRKSIGAAVHPVRVIVDAPIQLWTWLGKSITSRSNLEQELIQHKTEKLITYGRLQKLEALEAENKRLREMLNARSKVPDKTRVTEIMSINANPYNHSLIIDAGTQDGVFDGQALVGANGVIGQVIEAGFMTSLAMLISDMDHALPVEVIRNGLRTIVVGTGKIDSLELPFIVNNADIRIGDLLVTSGFGGAFPAGYPVATVNSVKRLPQESYAKVTAKPAASLDQAREVLLIFSLIDQDEETAEDE
jgi:rod shape-determining protein MreC